jgi:hypothetical protein
MAIVWLNLIGVVVYCLTGAIVYGLTSVATCSAVVAKSGHIDVAGVAGYSPPFVAESRAHACMVLVAVVVC